jgi:hypothetical protein
VSPVPGWLLRVASGVVLLIGLALTVLGLGLVVEDTSSHTDEWDGFGTFLGLAAAVPGVVLAAIAGLAWWLTRRHVRGAAVVLCLLGAMIAFAGVVLLSVSGALVSLAVTVVGLLVAGVGIAAAAGATASVDSPGGSSR